MSQDTAAYFYRKDAVIAHDRLFRIRGRVCIGNRDAEPTHNRDMHTGIFGKSVPLHFLYGSPEISGRECRFDLGHMIGSTYKASEAGAQATAQSERIRP